MLQGLAKRNFKDAEKTINAVIETDERKRAAQTALDQVLSESNKLSKEIGILFKSGEVQKANILKEKTGQLKEKSKELSELKTQMETELNELLYQIPNIPNALVPSGTSVSAFKNPSR